MSRAPLFRRVSSVLAASCAAAWLVSGCDNPACVFGGNCNEDSASSTAPNPASSPANHQWIVAGAPQIVDFFPEGNSIGVDTPVAVVFNESLSSASIQTAFALFQEGPMGGLQVPVPTAAPTLVGDGRVLIVAPLTALMEDATYELKLTDMANVTDLQGFALEVGAERVIGTFTVAATTPTNPRVIATFPPDGATNQSTTGEYIVVFDRKIDASTVTASSFSVKVGGNTPNPNPLPQPALLIGTGGIPASDTRVWRYRSTDSNNEAVPFPTNTLVELTLSPAGNEIESTDGDPLATVTFDYTTAPFGAPRAAVITSMPDDAIGIANLDGTTPLAVGVDLAAPGSMAVNANDVLDMFVVGRSTDSMGGLAMFSRSVRLGDLPSFDVPNQTVTIGEGQLDLASSTSPVTLRFGEGEFTVALALRRGNAISPVRLLDIDSTTLGVQDPAIDVTRPTLTGLGTSGTTTSSFRSDTRDLVVVGRANERIRVAEVVAGALNNGALAPVAAAQGTLFIAQPVAIGIVDTVLLPMPFTLTLYDQAMNAAAAPFQSSFTQLGAVIDASGIPPPSIEVEVFDARTLAALPNARVYLHGDSGGTLTAHGFVTSGPTGVATLNAGIGGVPIVTVELTGYDLFTFYDVPSNRIGVPLTRSSAQPGKVQGMLSTSSSELPQFERFVADSRAFESSLPEITVQTCTPNPTTFTWQCGFGPEPLRLGVLGGVGFVGVDPPASAFAFTPQGFLHGYALEVPQAPVTTTGGTSNVDFSVNQLLDDPDTDPESRAIAGPAGVFDANATVGLDLTQIAPSFPRIAVQGRVPGLSGAVLAGYGVAFDSLVVTGSAWDVLSAVPGVADPFDEDGDPTDPTDSVGELISEGTLEDELFLRVELRDDFGARVGLRTRFSQTPAAPLSLLAPSAPVVNAPASGSTTPSAAYDIDFDDVIEDGSGLSGLYRVTLVGSSGRQWVLYRLDRTGAAQANVELPDLAAQGGSPLPSGATVVSVSAYAWASFAMPFVFSDVEREHELFATGAVVMFNQP